MKLLGGLVDWLDSRTGIRTARKHLLDEPIPAGVGWWFVTGSVLILLLSVQLVTGIFLTMYYVPSPESAYDSVRYIMEGVTFGRVLRGLHFFGASFIVIAAVIHMLRVVALGSYKKPREVTWLTGVVLLLVILGFALSGYLLPWNELAFFATRVGTSSAGALPGIGESIVRFMRGGNDVTGATLTRFFGVHIAILPAITTALLALHLLFIQYHGMSVPPSIEAEQRRTGRAIKSMPFIPNFALRDLFGWTVALALLAGLAAYFPWELGKKADLFAPAPAGIRPEWYFLWMFQALKYAPATVFGLSGELVVMVPASIGAVLLVFLPFLDPDTPQSRGIVKVLAAAALVVMATLTVLAVTAKVQ